MASGTLTKVLDSAVLSTMFKIVSYSCEYSVDGNATKGITATDFNASTPAGYTVVGAVNFNTGSAQCSLSRIRAISTGSNQMMAFKNLTSNIVTNTASIDILYVRSEFVSAS